MTPQPPALPPSLLKQWPVIVAITVGWLIATLLAFTVAALLFNAAIRKPCGVSQS